MRGETKALGLVDTTENCWNVFIQRVKNNLHMVFCCSPVGENFRVRSQRFLATVTSTVIDWFQPWPEASLFSVAKKFLDEIDLGADALRSAVVEFMPYSFALVNKVSKKFFDAERRYNYTTPKTFLELIKLYKNVLTKKRKETQVRVNPPQRNDCNCNHQFLHFSDIILFKLSSNRMLLTVLRMV